MQPERRPPIVLPPTCGPATFPLVRVSGAVMTDQFHVMREMVGDEAMEKALLRLSDDDAHECQTLTAVGWYRCDAVTNYLFAVADEVGRSRDAFYDEVVQEGVRRTFNSIWRILLRITTDAAIVKRVPMIYSKTYDNGAMTARIPEPGRGEAIVTGWPDIPSCEIRALAVATRTVMEVAGRQNVVARWERTGDGARLMVSWMR